VLGKNGAGKSTMMNMLSTWYSPTAGQAMIRGLKSTEHKNAIRDFIGICNQQNLYWNTFTAYEHLHFFGTLRGVPTEDLDKVIKTFAMELKFFEHLDTHMNSLSGGNKRKVALCASIIGKSEVLYLDEPSAGVDPFARDEMRNCLLQLKKSKTILFTSHTMEEAEIMCDEIVIMKDGKVVEQGGCTELVQKMSSGYFLIIDASKKDTDEVKQIKNVVKSNLTVLDRSSVKEGEISYTVPFDSEKLSKIFEFALKLQEDQEVNVMVESASLEQLFKHVVHEDNATTPKAKGADVVIEMREKSPSADSIKV